MEQNTTNTSNDTTTTRSKQVKGSDANEIFNKQVLEGNHTKIEEVFGKELYLNAILYRTGKDGEYAIVQADTYEDEQELTISNGSRVVMEKLKKLTDGLKTDELGVYRFKTPYRIVFTKNKAESGREYHDIESWS